MKHATEPTADPTAEPATESTPERMEKELGLFDVYAISTGAMFASGFFLLPGIAAAQSGPAVVLAYGIASLLMIPTTMAIAELGTTMPRAGGPYYFIDRSFGPAMGTVGGLGVWFVLVLKSAFALVGMGAYLALVLNFPIEPVAVVLTIVFTALNLAGAKQGARLQQVLVVALMLLMIAFVVSGFVAIAQQGFAANVQERFTPLLPFGSGELLATVGLVFVSFAGLSKVASVAEEVDRPARNLPLGMGAALLSVTVIYVLGVYVIVAMLPPEELWEDLTPVASAARASIGWLPQWIVTGLVVVAAVSAFASTGNAGLLGASRIPMAMARDGLTWAGFDSLGRFGTPTRAILATSALMIATILLLDVESLARLASSFLLFVFALLNLTVIVMRESRIESYVPEFRVPLYPWTPILGMVVSVGLIIVLGWFYVFFLTCMIVLSLLWYWLYAARRVERRGAIYNVFARLAKRKHEPLEEELWSIMQEHTSTEQDLLDEVVAQAIVLDIQQRIEFDLIVERVGRQFAESSSLEADRLIDCLRESGGAGGPPISGEAVLIDLCLPWIDRSRLAIVRLRQGSERKIVEEVVGEGNQTQSASTPVIYAALFLISSEEGQSQHRRVLAALSARIEEPGFLELWQEAGSEQQLREVFLRSDRYILLRLQPNSPSAPLIGQRIDSLPLPSGCRAVAVHRGGDPRHPDPDLVTKNNDRLTVVGNPEAINQTFKQFHDGS